MPPEDFEYVENPLIFQWVFGIVNAVIKRYMAQDLTFRASVVDATTAVQEMQSLQNTYPIATMGVGRSMVAAILLASHLKEDHMVSLYFRGNGPLEMVFAEASYEGEVRGYTPQPQLELPLINNHIDLSGALGRGFLTVVRSLPNQKQPHRGTVEIQTGEIGDDVAFYLQQSHQIPSVVALGVKVNPYGMVQSAGGIFVELMPGANEQLIKDLEQKVSTLPSISEALANGATHDEIKDLLLKNFSLTELGSPKPIVYKCRCSKERLERALMLLGVEEIEKILKKGDNAEARCEFCGRHYVLEPEELKHMILTLQKPDTH